METPAFRARCSRRGESLALLLFAVALTAPFLDKAFHIDDTFYLQVTQNIVADPLDPYAGEIDWWHRPQPVWEGDSNPALLNYYLAPVYAQFGASEIALHAAMAPFVALFAIAMASLGRRFAVAPVWSAGFALTSAGILVSGNIMRDVPATALAAAAIAAWVAGSDRADRRWLATGSVLAGLAALTKYSALVLLPVMVLYPLLHGRLRQLAWAAIPAALFALWCLHNLWVYGEFHITSQLGRAFNNPGHGWRDNVAALPVVVGSLVYLAPVVLLRAFTHRDRIILAAAIVPAAASFWLVDVYTRGGAGAQFQFWNVGGTILLGACAASGLRAAFASGRKRPPGERSDAAFLLVWLFLPIAFSSISVPFQAIRHFLPALPPLVLLALRYAAPRSDAAPVIRGALATLLALQLSVSLLVAKADAEVADSYRVFAREARARATAAGISADADIWFVGHWGWMHYAQRAGFRQIHVTGPFPEPGDAVLVPQYVDQGRVLQRLPNLTERLRQIDEVVVPGSIPLRTVHPSGAGFYALFTRRGPDRPSRVPYRFEADAPLEIFTIHEVR